MPPSCALLADLQSVHELRCYGNITRTRNVSEYMRVLALCLVMEGEAVLRMRSKASANGHWWAAVRSVGGFGRWVSGTFNVSPTEPVRRFCNFVPTEPSVKSMLFIS